MVDRQNRIACSYYIVFYGVHVEHTWNNLPSYLVISPVCVYSFDTHWPSGWLGLLQCLWLVFVKYSIWFSLCQDLVFMAGLLWTGFMGNVRIILSDTPQLPPSKFCPTYCSSFYIICYCILPIVEKVLTDWPQRQMCSDWQKFLLLHGGSFAAESVHVNTWLIHFDCWWAKRLLKQSDNMNCCVCSAISFACVV
jgi:hypothetical protein